MQDYANNVSIKRLGFNDHGPVHMRQVANNAIKMLNIIHENNIQTSLEKEEMQLDFTQEELIELIQAKNKEIKKLREELEKSKKNINTKEVDDEVNELLERIKAK